MTRVFVTMALAAALGLAIPADGGAGCDPPRSTAYQPWELPPPPEIEPVECCCYQNLVGGWTAGDRLYLVGCPCSSQPENCTYGVDPETRQVSGVQEEGYINLYDENDDPVISDWEVGVRYTSIICSCSAPSPPVIICNTMYGDATIPIYNCDGC